MPWSRLTVRVALWLGALVVATPAMAAPSATAVRPAPCDLKAQVTLHWDLSNPKYARLVATGTATRCSAAIVEVGLQLANYYPTGEFHEMQPYPTMVHLPGRVGTTHTITGTTYVATEYTDNLRPDGIVTFTTYHGWTDFATCTTLANGSTTTKMTGATFEATLYAFDSSHHLVTQLRTGRLPCGQDGANPPSSGPLPPGTS